MLASFIAKVRAFQVSLVVKKPPANAEDIRDAGSIPGLGRSLGGGHGNPLHAVSISLRSEAEIKTFLDKGKLTEFFICRPRLCLKEVLDA